MSDTTIQVPAEHVEAIRQSLIERRGDPAQQTEVDRLLGQIDDLPLGVDATVALSGSRTALWSAVYDALCGAAEQLADDCNEYWRGTVEAESARARVAEVGTRLELLLALGAPPGGRTATV